MVGIALELAESEVINYLNIMKVVLALHTCILIGYSRCSARASGASRSARLRPPSPT